MLNALTLRKIDAGVEERQMLTHRSGRSVLSEIKIRGGRLDLWVTRFERWGGETQPNADSLLSQPGSGDCHRRC